MALKRFYLISLAFFAQAFSMQARAGALENFYAEQSVNEIKIYTGNWDSLRLQDPAGGICNFSHIGSRYDWYAADTVIVNGVSFQNAGIKKRSWCGSESKEKPSLAIKLDKFKSENKKPAVDSLGTEYLTLNNSKQDPSLVRQCLSYLFFRAAGLKAPLCNYTTLWVNDRYYGIYVNLQSYRKTFFEKNYGKPAGKLVELEATDFQWYALDHIASSLESFTDDNDAGFVNQLISNLDQADQGNWDPFLRQIDEQQILKFWAMEELLVHWDGLTLSSNNSYVYQHSDGRITFLPWGTDQILNRDGAEAYGSYANNRLIKKLTESQWHRDQKNRYLREFRDQLWDEGRIYSYLDDAQARLQGYVPSGELQSLWDGMGTLKWFVGKRRQQPGG